MQHRRYETNGIELHVAEAGEGRPVVLCHGFPELGRAWRHQLPALAGAGWRALAPDMRGFGDSSIPDDPTAYDMFTIADDLAGLLDAAGESSAVFVGHDMGAVAVWYLARIHPERVDAVVGMSVPFTPRLDVPPTQLFRAMRGDDFYIPWFQEPGVADAALGADVRRALMPERTWTPQSIGELSGDPPEWMEREDWEALVRTYERTGFTGALNWYRCLDRTWELEAAIADRKVEAPALFLTGEKDVVREYVPDALMDEWVPNLREKVIVPGAGHWVQQERPAEVNAALLGFLGTLDGAPAPAG